MARCLRCFAWLLHHEDHILSQTSQVARHQKAVTANNAIFARHLLQLLGQLIFANVKAANLQQSWCATRIGLEKDLL